GLPRSLASSSSAFQASLLGFTWPFSHRLTVEKVTLRACASPSWVSPMRRRQARIMRPASRGGLLFRSGLALMILRTEATQVPQRSVDSLCLSRPTERHRNACPPAVRPTHHAPLRLGGGFAKRGGCPSRRQSCPCA